MKSLVDDIPSGDGKTAKLFLQCTSLQLPTNYSICKFKCEWSLGDDYPVQPLTLFANFLPVSFLAARGHWSATRDTCEEHAISWILLWLLPEIAAGQCCQLFPFFSGQFSQKKTTGEKKFSPLKNTAKFVVQCQYLSKFRFFNAFM
jgi:hypothetical protein